MAAPSWPFDDTPWTWREAAQVVIAAAALTIASLTRAALHRVRRNFRG